MGVGRGFADDSLGYFGERLDREPTREALASVLRRAKRNKAFENSWWIGLAVDGTGAGRSREARCALCHPVYDADHEVRGYLHHFCLISVVGTGLSLPFDVEPYPPGDSEYAAGQRLLERAVGHLGPRFADYVVGDGEFATAPFLHEAGDLGLYVVARLKGNLPELYASAQARFAPMPPALIFQDGPDRVEMWDADDFDPWETLRWRTVRVIRYKQYKPNGTVVEAYWLTDFPLRKIGSRSLYEIAKSRWEVENQGFNEGKNHAGMEHIAHHDARCLEVRWLLIALALTIERLYRLRCLHRGTHRPLTAIDLVRCFRLSLCPPRAPDSS
jgi:hypothetical protein